MRRSIGAPDPRSTLPKTAHRYPVEKPRNRLASRAQGGAAPRLAAKPV
ncbi:MAG: hypothetical protein ACM3NW_11415 [Syntrophomonadaceae bacterium]